MANPMTKETFSDRLPNTVEISHAEKLKEIVTSQVARDGSIDLSLALDDGRVEPLTLVPSLTTSLLELLTLVSSGCGFRMIPISAELTTQQAADLLNVPRHYLIKLLDDGEIEFSKEGRHRRIRAEHLFDYKEKRDANRTKTLDEMMRQDAEMDLI